MPHSPMAVTSLCSIAMSYRKPVSVCGGGALALSNTVSSKIASRSNGRRSILSISKPNAPSLTS